MHKSAKLVNSMFQLYINKFIEICYYYILMLA
jgi:hypothetical protein